LKSNYKRLGDYIEPCNEKNEGNHIKILQGISNRKYFQKAKTNTIGIDLSKYRVVRKGQFAFNRATTRNGDRISIALRFDEDCIVSPSYRIFKSKDENILNSEYLMMWFKRPEFDRYARFKSHGSAHEFFDLDEMYEVELPIPSIEKQNEIVNEYNTITNRIALNEQLNQKLEETAQALYKHWFVDFEFPNEEGQPYKSSGGKMVYNEELDKEIPEGWEVSPLKDVTSKIGSGSTPRGGKGNYKSSGVSLIRSMNVFDFKFKNDDLAFINNQQAEKLKGVTVYAKDVLLNITGASVARCCIVPAAILPARVNQHVAIIRMIKKRSYYLLCNLCYSEIKKELIGVSESGSTREAITKDDLDNFKITIPNDGVGDLFEDKISLMFSYKITLDEERIRLQKVKDLLLSKMTKVEAEKEIINLKI
tara:strand:- start:5460 stop:6722 length:1263 start_codon:yes stop_codon:yes gene_type:complete